MFQSCGHIQEIFFKIRWYGTRLGLRCIYGVKHRKKFTQFIFKIYNERLMFYCNIICYIVDNDESNTSYLTLTLHRYKIVTFYEFLRKKNIYL